MTHHRERFERVYARTEHVAPAHLIYESSDAEADHFFMKKLLAFNGLSPLRAASGWLKRRMNAAELQNRREVMVEHEEIVTVHVEGWKEPHYALATDVPLLETLMGGVVPNAWIPRDTTTDDEVTFLAPPIRSVPAAGKLLFDFDYVWEVYKPAHRASGATTRCHFVGRSWGRVSIQIRSADPHIGVCGFWLEETARPECEVCSRAVERHRTG